jgi:hypothetical protein
MAARRGLALFLLATVAAIVPGLDAAASAQDGSPITAEALFEEVAASG